MTSETTEPTPEEMSRYRVESLIEDALVRFCDDLDRLIDQGKVSAEQAEKFLRFSPDFSDAWTNWLAESEEGEAEKSDTEEQG